MEKTGKREVLIFYSSESEPEIPSVYHDGLQYLNGINVKSKLIDVNKNPKIAEKYNVIVTPIFIVIQGKQRKKYVGIISGFKNLLESTLHGKSILHSMGFKEGRNIGKNIRFKDKDQLGEDLGLKLSNKGISAFKVLQFDGKNNNVKVRLISDIGKESKKGKMPVCNEVSSFLGGIFTEMLDKGVHFIETQCIAQGNSYCEFKTIDEDIKEVKDGRRKQKK